MTDKMKSGSPEYQREYRKNRRARAKELERENAELRETLQLAMKVLGSAFLDPEEYSALLRKLDGQLWPGPRV